MFLGIDLGTTYSAAAVINDDGQAEIITNRDGERFTPSVIMFEKGTVVVGSQAKDNSVIDPDNVCQYVKRHIGKKSFSFDVSLEKQYTAEEISALILKRLKEDAETYCSKAVEGAVITIPAYFDDAQRKATKDAGEIAGLNVIGIINEPTAAAIAYCYGKSNSDGNIMVYDLGGGTFDITVMRLSENLEKVDILSTTGDRNLGGFDFDNEIIKIVKKEFEEKYGIDLNEDDIAFQELRIKAENAKKALSNRPKTAISIVSQGHALKVTITREEFESSIQGHLNTTKLYMEEAMEDAGLKWNEIDKIILVGGSTRIPAVRNMIKELSGIEPSQELNPDEAVAIGAAYYADLKGSRILGENTKAKKEIQVTDVNSHSVGIITRNLGREAEVVFVIKRNTPLPAEHEEIFCTTVDRQEQLEIEIVEGEDLDPSYDRLIGRSFLSMKTLRPCESPIGVKFKYDENGMIHVSVRDLVDGADLGEIHVTRDSNLSEDEVKEKQTIICDINVE